LLCRIASDESAGNAAQQPVAMVQIAEKHPSGAKALLDYESFAAVMAKAMTYQSCPDTSRAKPE
jgi:hypothetical protein